MSATPIPKSMNMAFTGIKDFSYLYTSPSNRLPIKTFLEVFSKSKINEALLKEKLIEVVLCSLLKIIFQN